jgi:hypothetical protein
VTGPSEDAVAFDRFLGSSSPEIAATARTVRHTILELVPNTVEWFDPGNGVLAFGATRTMKDLIVAIVPHRAHVNVQLVDGVDLPNPDGRIEGTGKRARHVKVRSLDEASAPWLRAAITAQVAFRSPAGT